MKTSARICQREGCGKPLPSGSATQRKYCTGRCQRAESRRRTAAALADLGSTDDLLLVDDHNGGQWTTRADYVRECATREGSSLPRLLAVKPADANASPESYR